MTFTPVSPTCNAALHLRLIKSILCIFALRHRSSSTTYTVRFPCVGKLEVHGFGKYVPKMHGD